MRPLELSLEGFRSYRESQAFSFEGRGLFGIVGPTGAGKTSILDALIYALYGRTPQVPRDTKKLVNSFADEARVRLVFEVDDQVWEVVRVIRGRGPSQVVLSRDGEMEETGAGAANERIEELVGLDFDAFCSSVTLPQGEFDRFLHATPSQRTQILKRVFRMERVDAMREAAKEKSGALHAQRSGLVAGMGALPADPDRLQAAGNELEAATERASLMNKAVASMGELEGRVENARAEHSAALAEMARWESARGRIPDKPSLTKLAEREYQAVTAAKSAKAELDKREKALTDARARLAQAEETQGGASLARAKEVFREIARLEGRLGLGTKRLEELTAGVLRVKAEQEKRAASAVAAEEARDRAGEALVEAQREHAAHVLRLGLQPGGRCPVCEQSVDAVPPKGKAPVLDRAVKALEKAEVSWKGASKAASEAERSLSSAEARRDEVSREVQSHQSEITGASHELAGLLPGAKDARAEIARREEFLAEAAATSDLATDAVAGARDGLAKAKEATEEVAGARRLVAGAVIAVCAQLDLELPSTEEQASSLTRYAESARVAVDKATAAANHRAELALDRAKADAGILEEFRSKFEIAPGTSSGEALARANEEVGALRAEIRQIEEALQRAETLREDIRRIDERRSLYERLVADLTDSKFTAYLLESERRLLAQLGSERLMQLTGRYRFDDDGRFMLVDTLMGEAIRSPDTLSGGETFLASLALALALAESLSRGRSPLGCFFLDEGFGSLDAASLDEALDGIEDLAAPGRLIGLISHLGGVQARLDDLIVLERNPDGTTIVVQPEGPLAYQAATI